MGVTCRHRLLRPLSSCLTSDSIFPFPSSAAPAAPETTDPAALLSHLQRHSPETLALAREWPALIERLPLLAGAIASKTKEDTEYKGLGMMSLHYRLSPHLHLWQSQSFMLTFHFA